MNRTKLVLFGSMGVAVDCLEWLISCDEYEVLGVVCSLEPRAEWRNVVGDRNMLEEAGRLGVKILKLDDLCAPGFMADIGLSVRFHQILKQRHLERFQLGVINFHAAPLPKYRGAMALNAALLEGANTFGITLHWMDEGVDSGDILVTEHFEISRKDTAFDVFQRCNETGLALIKRSMGDIISGKIRAESQASILERTGGESLSLLRAKVVSQKNIPAELDAKRLWDAVRAFQFPGHEPAYIETPDGRVYVRIDSAVARGN